MRLVTPTRQFGITKSTEDQKEHAREAVRLRSLAHTVTTAATKARVLQQAEEHARLAGHGDRAWKKPRQSPSWGSPSASMAGYLRSHIVRSASSRLRNSSQQRGTSSD